jgi:hypothetical protein
MSFLKSSILELVNKVLVSSANKTDLEFTLIASDQSFMLRRKSKGPKTDPCGTLCFIIPSLKMPCD